MDTSPIPSTIPIPPENRRKLGAFWRKTSNRGETFLSGELTLKNLNGSDERIQVLLLKVQTKHSDKTPDYELLLTKDELEKRIASTKQGNDL